MTKEQVETMLSGLIKIEELTKQTADQLSAHCAQALSITQLALSSLQGAGPAPPPTIPSNQIPTGPAGGPQQPDPPPVQEVNTAAQAETIVNTEVPGPTQNVQANPNAKVSFDVETPTAYTPEDMLAAIQQATAKGKLDEVIKLAGEFGVVSFGNLPPEKYPAAMLKLKGLLV